MSTLANGNHNATLRVGTLRVRVNAIIVTQSDVNQTTLVCRHRRKVHGAARPTAREAAECAMLTTLS